MVIVMTQERRVAHHQRFNVGELTDASFSSRAHQAMFCDSDCVFVMDVQSHPEECAVANTRRKCVHQHRSDDRLFYKRCLVHSRRQFGECLFFEDCQAAWRSARSERTLTQVVRLPGDIECKCVCRAAC